MVFFSLGTCWNLRESLKVKTIPVWNSNPSLYFPLEILFSFFYILYPLETISGS